MPHTAFDGDFAHFMAHSDEKAVLARALTDQLTRTRSRSLLDVGAGDGTLAVPLARVVDRYVAVESHPDYAAALAAAGLTVLPGPFPTPVPGKFDTVLACHVISYRADPDGGTGGTRDFLEAAWDLVAPGGQLVVITHRGLVDDWARMRAALDWAGSDPAPAFDRLKAHLTQMGELTVDQIVSHLSCTTATDMVRGLAFMAAYGREPARSQFLSRTQEIAALLGPYRTPAGYRFPFTHLRLTVRRPS